MTDHIALGVLASVFPRDLVEDVLGVTGKREKRSRLLPAHVMVRYVIALGLFFGEPYEEVIRRLTGSLRAVSSWDDDWKVPTTSAITQARRRLGEDPLRELFHRAAVPLATSGTKGAWLRGRRLMAIDGTSFDVPDTPDNLEVFGRMGSGPKASAYPKINVVTLAECGTHAHVAAAIDGCRIGERTLAAHLTSAFEPDMLVLADSGFFSWDLWQAACERGADLAWRIGASVELPLVDRLDDGSYLALIYAPRISAAARAALLARARAGQEIAAERARIVRAVEYTVPDRPGSGAGELICVITTILDPGVCPAVEVAGAYHERWEHESGLDEIKTHLRGGGAILRSRSPDLVRQELWGLLLAHYAVRSLMCRAADEAGYDPDRLSFSRSVRVVRRQIDDPAAFSP